MAKGRVSRSSRRTRSYRGGARSKRVAAIQRPQLYKASASRRPQTVRVVLEHVGATPQVALPSGTMQTFNAIRKARM